MNILISTTTNWNHGDDFIRMGVLNLLRESLGDFNQLFYDRNPDYLKMEQSSSNIFNFNLNPNIIDLVVIAGSPEFLHKPLEPLYKFLYDNPQIPCLVIGVGYGLEQLHSLSNEEMSVLGRDNVQITTRQQDLANNLNKVLNTNKVVALPCPALFCQTISLREPKEKLGMIIQTPRPFMHGVPSSVFDNIYNLHLNNKSKIICTYKTELNTVLHNDIDMKDVIFKSRPEDFLKSITSFNKIISSRLHGAIGAMAGGRSPCIFTNKENHRIVEVLKMMEGLVKVYHEPKIFSELDFPSQFQISVFKNKTKQKYLKLLRSYLTKLKIYDRL